MRRRWLFADQLGPHFRDSPEQPLLLIESKAVFRRRAFHRQKAHLILSALRHRAQDSGVRLIRAETYAEAITEPLTVCHPTSRAARGLVQRLPNVEMLPPRGFVTAPQDFVTWANRRTHLRLEDFYRNARRRHDVLMDGAEPAGGRWNLDADNRKPPPRGADRLDVPPPPPIVEDEIDAQVRADLDRWQRDDGVTFVGNDGPRLFPATREEALNRLRHFVEHRLPTFGPYEDAMLAGDPLMAHSMLSAAINLGLLDPLEVIEAAEQAFRAGDAPLAGVEGFVRQILGWRDFVWHLYWYFEPQYRAGNELNARGELPTWFADLDADAVEARCLSDVLTGVRDRGWVHHIPRLMVLGNYAMQRGWRPGAVADWFHRCFVDGYEWVMTANVIGMSQFADGGRMSSKPYAAGGAYINRMSDYCPGCRYRPAVRVGDDACPYTAVTGASSPATSRTWPATTGWRSRCAACTASPTSTPCSNRSRSAAPARPRDLLLARAGAESPYVPRLAAPVRACGPPRRTRRRRAGRRRSRVAPAATASTAPGRVPGPPGRPGNGPAGRGGAGGS